MPAASQDADGRQQDRSVERVVSLLQESLGIIDDWGDCPEIGARLQHVIDCVEERGRPLESLAS